MAERLKWPSFCCDDCSVREVEPPAPIRIRRRAIVPDVPERPERGERRNIGGDGATLEEVADELGLTGQGIGLITERALGKARATLGDAA